KPYESKEEENKKPKIVKGWWSFDEKGEEIYRYNDKEKNSIPLGETMYFHVEVEDIDPGERLKLQLYDYDYYIWDYADPDTSKFPNDPVITEAMVEQTGGKYIATIKQPLKESWETVIKDDSDDAFRVDQ